VNRYKNPVSHKQVALYLNVDPYIVASHLKILIPVGTAMLHGMSWQMSSILHYAQYYYPFLRAGNFYFVGKNLINLA
jgi:hypothetical protein